MSENPMPASEYSGVAPAVQCAPGWVAEYTWQSPDGVVAQITRMSVVAWSQSGEALVCDEETGRLLRAHEASPEDLPEGVTCTLRAVHEPNPYETITGVVPGQGWRIRSDRAEGGEGIAHVIAFLITQGGRVNAMCLNERGNFQISLYGQDRFPADELIPPENAE